MKHYLYCSAGNTEGLDEYIAFFEIAEDGYCSRYIEIRSVGHALKYTEDEPADEFGVLPEWPWDALEAAKLKYGTLNEIWENESIEDFLESANAWAEDSAFGSQQSLSLASSWR